MEQPRFNSLYRSIIRKADGFGIRIDQKLEGAILSRLVAGKDVKEIFRVRNTAECSAMLSGWTNSSGRHNETGYDDVDRSGLDRAEDRSLRPAYTCWAKAKSLLEKMVAMNGRNAICNQAVAYLTEAIDIVPGKRAAELSDEIFFYIASEVLPRLDQTVDSTVIGSLRKFAEHTPMCFASKTARKNLKTAFEELERLGKEKRAIERAQRAENEAQKARVLTDGESVRSMEHNAVQRLLDIHSKLQLYGKKTIDEVELESVQQFLELGLKDRVGHRWLNNVAGELFRVGNGYASRQDFSRATDCYDVAYKLCHDGDLCERIRTRWQGIE